MLIPKKIRVSKKWFTVLQPDVITPGRPMGRISYGVQLIQVAQIDRRGQRFKREERYDTFWHELTHAILADMEHPLERNEKFVRAFANRLTGAILSAKF